MNIIGVDVGGTKIAVGRISDQRLEKVLTVKTKATASQAVIVSQITALIDKLLDKNTHSIGIAVPAIVDVEKGLVFETVNIPSWKNVPLKKLLEQKYHLPVYVNNDANCFALGEKCFGQGKKYHHLVAVSISTGLGAGIIINDKLYCGHNCGAGEFGEIVYQDHNFEHYCSGKFFLEEHHLSGAELFLKAQRNQPAALKIFQEYGHHLGKVLAAIVHSFDPELIILGGSISKSYSYFEKSMKESLQQSTYARSFARLKIVVSKLEHPVLLGAAKLANNKIK